MLQWYNLLSNWYRGSFQRIQRRARQVAQSPPPSAEVENEWRKIRLYYSKMRTFMMWRGTSLYLLYLYAKYL
jgi:hypothetical protein